MKKTIIVLILCIFSSTLFAQNILKEVVDEVIGNSLYCSVETGITGFNAFERDYDFIREEASYYYGYYGNYSALSLTSFATYASVNAEYRMLSGHLWVSGGLKYTNHNSSIAKYSGSDSHPDYFYVLLNQQEDESYYYRISEVRFLNHYIGVPLDFNFAPISSRYFKLYGKLGVDLNFKIRTNKKATFFDETMSYYESDILVLFGDTQNFFATANIGGGMQIGQEGKPNVRFELDVASIVLTPDAFALVNQNVGFGANISLLIPLNK